MHHLSILNFTQETLLVTFSNISSESRTPTSILSSRGSTFTSSSWNGLGLELIYINAKCIAIGHRLASPSRKLYFKATWELVPCSSVIPWSIFRLKTSPKRHHLIIFPRRSLSSFLADMPSSLPLSSLLLPGTHESVAFYGWPVSQCQDPATPLATQLLSGIRTLDVRLSIVNGKLVSYHGIYPQKLPFRDILRIVHSFLSSPHGRTEAIVMSIKQEDQASFLFSQLVHDAVYNGPGGRQMWFLENRIPNLGEVRGKVVMFSRFGGNGEGWEGGLEGLGIHPTIWPDSKITGFEWWLKGTKVKTHDWYSIPSFLAIPEKAAWSSEILLHPESPPLYPILSIAFLSAASFPLALPPVVACGFGWPAWGMGVEGVNSRVGKWILNLFAENHSKVKLQDTALKKVKADDISFDALTQLREPRLRGWCFMDFYQDPMDLGLIQLLIECNYRGREAGKEGWL